MASTPAAGPEPSATTPELDGVLEEKREHMQGDDAASPTMLSHQKSAELNDFPEDMSSNANRRLNQSLTDEELRHAKAKMSESSASIQEAQDLAVSGQIMARLTWSFASVGDAAADTDLDISAVVFDIEGVVMDACYYNQKWVLDGALRHSGDDRFGAFAAEESKDEAQSKRSGEAVKVVLESLPEEAVAVFFVVNCYRGGRLRDIENSRAVFAVKDGPTLVDMDLAADTDLQDEPGLILGFLYRSRKNPPSWMFRETPSPVDAYNFTRAMETMRIIAQRSKIISDVLVAPILNGRKVFHMRKGDYAKLPSGMRYVSVGLGWQTRGRSELDLDTAAVVSGYGQVNATNTGPKGIGLAKRELLHLDTVWFSQRYDRLTGGNFIIRSLDNVTGDGSGDDEVIHVDLQNAPPYVREITFVVNIYDKNKGFDKCRNSYIRLMLDAGGEGFGGKEVARFPITGRIHTNGLVFACLFRNGTDWNFRTIGEGCWGRHVLHDDGNTVEVCLHQVPGEDIVVAEEEEEKQVETLCSCGPWLN